MSSKRRAMGLKYTVKDLQRELRRLMREEKVVVAALQELKKLKTELTIEQLELSTTHTKAKIVKKPKPKVDTQPQMMEKPVPQMMEKPVPQETEKNEPLPLNLEVDDLLACFAEGRYYASEHDSDDDSFTDVL